MPDLLIDISSQAERFVDDVEQWKMLDDQLAEAASELGEILQGGIDLFDHLNDLDERVRRSISRGKMPYSAELNAFIKAVYRRWLSASKGGLEAIEILERHGHGLANAEDFRDRCREATGILTPDCEFFSDQRLVDLRDEALDEHARGDTREYRPA